MTIIVFTLLHCAPIAKMMHGHVLRAKIEKTNSKYVVEKLVQLGFRI